jgi:hypothetical protein
MGIFRRLRHGIRGGNPRRIEDAKRIAEAVERLTRLSPQLRLAKRYRSRLEPAVAVSLKYSDDLIASIPASREASAAAWSTDPYIHAFFAAPDDIAKAFSRSPELRAYFEENAGVDEAYAVLGMAMKERNTLGVALEGETMRRDVMQTTVSFSDYRVRICGRSEDDLRQELARRFVDQLGLEGLARIAADKSRRDLLEQERALLKTRLQLLERQGVGMRAVLGGDAEEESEELERLQVQIEENEKNLDNLGIRSEALDRELGRLCEVLAVPRPHIYIANKNFRLNKMNVVLAGNSTRDGENFTFQIARIPTTPPQMRAFTLVRFARKDLLPAVNLLDEAARLLI